MTARMLACRMAAPCPRAPTPMPLLPLFGNGWESIWRGAAIVGCVFGTLLCRACMRLTQLRHPTCLSHSEEEAAVEGAAAEEVAEEPVSPVPEEKVRLAIRGRGRSS